MSTATACSAQAFAARAKLPGKAAVLYPHTAERDRTCERNGVMTGGRPTSGGATARFGPTLGFLWSQMRWLSRAVDLWLLIRSGTGRKRNPFRYGPPEEVKDEEQATSTNAEMCQ